MFLIVENVLVTSDLIISVGKWTVKPRLNILWAVCIFILLQLYQLSKHMHNKQRMSVRMGRGYSKTNKARDEHLRPKIQSVYILSKNTKQTESTKNRTENVQDKRWTSFCFADWFYWFCSHVLLLHKWVGNSAIVGALK